MSKASLLFTKLAQKGEGKLHWYGPTHPQARRIRSEFASQGAPVSRFFPVTTDTSAAGITLIGYKGRGFSADVLRKTKHKTTTDSLNYRGAKKYLYGVANKRGYSLHRMGDFTSD